MNNLRMCSDLGLKIRKRMEAKKIFCYSYKIMHAHDFQLVNKLKQSSTLGNLTIFISWSTSFPVPLTKTLKTDASNGRRFAEKLVWENN